MVDAREEQFKLQNENQELRRQIQVQENWDKKKAEYQLQKTTGGAFVYASLSTSPAHYACPRCIEKHEIQILQDLNVSSGAFGCPGCQAKYPVKPRTKIEVEISGGGPRSGRL